MNVIKASFEWNSIIVEKFMKCVPYGGPSLPGAMF